MHIEIKRIRQIGENIEGHLLIDSRSDHCQNLQYVCDTLENHHSSLPPGQYRVEVVKCRFRSRKMPLVITPAHSPEPDTPTISPARICSKCAKAGHEGINSSPHKRHATGEAVFCPMLAPGNGIHNRHDGSILVGKRGARGLLLHPLTTFDLLYDRIRRSAERGNEVTLTIR